MSLWRRFNALTETVRRFIVTDGRDLAVAAIIIAVLLLGYGLLA